MSQKIRIKDNRFLKITKTVFVVLSALVTVFELFQAAGFAVTKVFLRPYAVGIAVMCCLLAAAIVLTLKGRYVSSLILTVVSTVGLTAVGYIITHPAADSDGWIISGIPEGVLWKYFAPSLLLIIPAVMIAREAARVREIEEIRRPYERQFD